MPHRKHGEDATNRVTHPSEFIAREFNEPGIGLPLEDAALAMDEQGQPIQASPRERQPGPGPGRSQFHAPKRAPSKGRADKKRAERLEDRLMNTGSGVEAVGSDSETIPGGGRPLSD